MYKNKYIIELDGLRGLAVILTLLFHCKIPFVSGGFIGVDIFFVISGYLITNIIRKHILHDTFSYKNFYKKRLLRLGPSFIITILLCIILFSLTMTPIEFDYLGKDIFYSTIGIVNLHFSRGVNYFNEDNSPILHLWSLSVEEQFYLLWPTLLISLNKYAKKYIFFILLCITLTFFFISHFSSNLQSKSYFLLQYRCFELLMGSCICFLEIGNIQIRKYFINYIKYIHYICIVIILIPAFYLDGDSSFPGFNALVPCLGTAILIKTISYNSLITSFLRLKFMVIIGLCSYPFYLVHQPINYFLVKYTSMDNIYANLLLVIAISFSISWIIYKYIEIPIRQYGNISSNNSKWVISTLIILLISLTTSGYVIAKSNGFPDRFKYINNFAYEIIQNNKQSYYQTFNRGINKLNDGNSRKALFFGDSLMEQYVKPIIDSYNLNDYEITTVTRGGCVLLKNAKYIDKYSDISQKDLYNYIYKHKIKYDIVFFSQYWDSYNNSISNLNIKKGVSNYEIKKWGKFIQSTIQHFNDQGSLIVIIGNHVNISNVEKLKPSIYLQKNEYIKNLKLMKLENLHSYSNKDDILRSYLSENVYLLSPIKIWGAGI